MESDSDNDGDSESGGLRAAGCGQRRWKRGSCCCCLSQLFSLASTVRLLLLRSLLDLLLALCSVSSIVPPPLARTAAHLSLAPSGVLLALAVPWPRVPSAPSTVAAMWAAGSSSGGSAVLSAARDRRAQLAARKQNRQPSTPTDTLTPSLTLASTHKPQPTTQADPPTDSLTRFLPSSLALFRPFLCPPLCWLLECWLRRRLSARRLWTRSVRASRDGVQRSQSQQQQPSRSAV